MSIETASLGIMSLDMFKSRTKASTSVCGFASKFKSRGSSVMGVDGALSAWEQLSRQGGAKDSKFYDTRLFALQYLGGQCQSYLNFKEDRATSLSEHRKGVVRELLRSVKTAESYLAHRAKQNPSRSTKVLDGVYGRERTHYEAVGKREHPMSASALHERDKASFNQLALADFQQAAAAGGERVQFLDRVERLEHLVVIKNGLLYQNGALYSCERTVSKFTGDREVEAATYAIDKYGNVFSKKSHAGVGGLRFNHSTYLAGKEVMCAGTLTCIEGVLLKITNSSGHYKPGGEHIRSALILLGEEGVNLKDVVVEGLGLVSGDGFCRAQTLVRSGAPAPADWPSQPGKSAYNTKVTCNGVDYTVFEPR